MNEKNFKIYFDDILESIDKIEEYTKDISQDKFNKNSQIQDAVVRRIEIIGEAANNIPVEIRKKYPDMPWKDIIGMRNILIHHYGGVDLKRVWRVAKTEFTN
ncbi:MAG: HepT-like ribonuclease domain-containing protein [Elusimicrobiota bacterium]